ncbi:MAG: ribonuclease J [bacterium]
MMPGHADLWFLPLGGCGEIGMNMNLYGHDGQWLMVDCGVTFAKPGASEPHVQMPDPTFIEGDAHNLSALLITHAHEDHIGAVAHLWPKLGCPVYLTAFSAAIVRRKLAEHDLLDQVPLHIIEPGSRQQLGEFDIQWLSLTHSTPQSQALWIKTKAGSILHTGDWKIDRDPVVGPPIIPSDFQALAEENVLAMVCDSTNALNSGHSVSEGDLLEGLHRLIADAPGRVVVGCFGSNIARLHTLVSVAAQTGRYAGVLGRSLNNYLQAARQARLWDKSLSVIEASHLGYLPPREVLAIATGSQGESGAALSRLAADTHPDLSLQAGDTVILSARVIPGNEVALSALLDRLQARGVRVVSDESLNFPIHASGHPCQDELTDMYRWVQPEFAIPVHGEAQHMAANAEVAMRSGVPRSFVGENGDLFMLAPVPGVRRGFAEVGRLGFDRGRLVSI